MHLDNFQSYFRCKATIHQYTDINKIKLSGKPHNHPIELAKKNGRKRYPTHNDLSYKNIPTIGEIWSENPEQYPKI